MSIVTERIKEILTSRNMSTRELGRLTGIPQATMNRYVTTETLKIPIPKLELIASALHVTPAYLMGWETSKAEGDSAPDNIRPVTTRRFRMLGEIACGEPIFADEDHESYIDASADIKADFCLTARGDSMIGARIHDGDVVFIRSQPIVENGEIAAVIIDGEATLKRWYFDQANAKLVLAPENSAYPPLVYVGTELDSITCLGKAVCFMSNL